MKIKLQIAILWIILFSITVHAQQTINPKFEQKIEELIAHSVATISCERLQEKMKTSNYCILDAREKKEYEVSHLPNAKWVGYDHFDKNALKDIAKEEIIVVYCSIGYRSEKIGEKLKKMGYSRVYNLYGGIFEWTNRQYLLVDNKNQTTTNIHAYNKEWGAWLDKGNKKY